jgi:hypothetical protein
MEVLWAKKRGKSSGVFEICDHEAMNEQLCEKLKEEALANATRDALMAAQWLALEEEAWQLDQYDRATTPLAVRLARPQDCAHHAGAPH